MAFFSVKDVYKSFGSTKVLKGIDFDLEEGQVLAIIGSSGSGKTTLLRCINFLEIPDKADIFLNGENIFSINNLDNQDSDGGPVQEQNLDVNEPTTVSKNDDTTVETSLNNSQEASVDMAVEQVKNEDKKQEIKQKKISKEYQRQIANQSLKFGMVFQSFNLFPHYNVKKNLVLAARLKYDKSIKNPFAKYFSKQVRRDRKLAFDEIDKNATDLLQRVGLSEKHKSYPCELSGGQQQRVAIARALILEPEILCFDEPTSALDPELTREVLKVIKGLKQDGHTMIVVTHEMEFARKVADKVIFMADGVIEEQGSPEEVFGNPQSPKTQAFLHESEKNIDED